VLPTVARRAWREGIIADLEWRTGIRSSDIPN